MSIYLPNIPTGLINLDTDYQNLQNNFQQLDTSFGIDHFAFSNNTSNNGYHTIIHQPPNGGVSPIDPTPIAGINQIYAKNVTVNAVTDTQLFSMTGAGGISQLTGNHAAANGYQWIGGMLIQWGIVFLTNGSVNAPTTGTVNFVFPNINFPNACFTVITSLQSTVQTSSSNTVGIVGTPGTSSFNWGYTGTKSYNNFYWFAIGN